mmetsp:Transcript_17052/g.24697  ORF Transcript_17052/g.24697 Transcript_17052/m.24697 type:complete len:233 (-) Transcript_17052:178-876(-)
MTPKNSSSHIVILVVIILRRSNLAASTWTQWVIGNFSSNCDVACDEYHPDSMCSFSNVRWPLDLNSFKTVISNTFDTISHQQFRNSSCNISWNRLTSHPHFQNTSHSCTFGGMISSCSAEVDKFSRRFCPCIIDTPPVQTKWILGPPDFSCQSTCKRFKTNSTCAYLREGPASRWMRRESHMDFIISRTYDIDTQKIMGNLCMKLESKAPPGSHSPFPLLLNSVCHSMADLA